MYQQISGALRVSGHGHFHDPSVEQVGSLRSLRELRQWSRQLQAEVYNNPLRNFGKWPMPRRWPPVQQQQAFRQRAVHHQQQVIVRRQQAMGRQQPPPKDYTGSRAMQTTTSKCPTRAVAMTVAIAKLLPAAIAEPPSAAVPQRAAVVGLLPVAAPAVEEIPPVAVQQPAVGIAEPPAAFQQPAVAVPQPADGIQQAAAVVVGFHPMAAADRPFIARPMAAAWPLPFLWPPPVTWLPAMDQDDRIWQQQQQQHFCGIAASEDISEEAIDAFIANARLEFDQRQAKLYPSCLVCFLPPFSYPFLILIYYNSKSLLPLFHN